jgi:hypothetical protein
MSSSRQAFQLKSEHNHVRHVAMIVVSVFDNIHAPIELFGVQISSTNKQTSLPVLAQCGRSAKSHAKCVCKHK